MLCPAPTWPTTMPTVTRMPRTHGLPPITAGSCVMRSKLVIRLRSSRKITPEWHENVCPAASRKRLPRERKRLGFVHAEAETSAVDMHAQASVFREVVDHDDRPAKPCRGADAEGPARAEPVGDPADDRRADRGAAEGDGE